MEKYLPYAVLLLRIALALTLLSLVTDKPGYWGEPGATNILWGEWEIYEKFLQSITPFLPATITEYLAIVLTALEAILALMLLFGIKVRWAAVGTGLYTLTLAVLTLLYLGAKAPFNYSLFVTSTACFLLACCPIYRFSLNGVKKRSTYHPY